MHLSDHGRGAVEEMRAAATSNACGLSIAPVCTTQGQRHDRSSCAGVCARLNTVGARSLVGSIRVGGRFTSRNERSWNVRSGERRTQLQELVLDRSANPQPFIHVSAGIRKCSFDHVPDLLPDAPIELNQSHLLDRSEIIRTRVDLDAGQ